jgi:hypothetical protein
VSDLYPGDTSDEVLVVQRRLGLAVTGVYDEATQQRVRGLQVLFALPVRDGVYDDEVRAILFNPAGSPQMG